MVYKKSKNPRGSSWIKRGMCIVGALVVAALCLAPAAAPVYAMGDGRPSHFAYYDWEMTISGGLDNFNLYYSVPLYNSVSKGSAGTEDLLFYGEGANGLEDLIAYMNVGWNNSRLSYDVYSKYPLNTVFLEWSGLALYPSTADETVLNCLPGIRVPGGASIGFVAEFGYVERDYIGAVTEVGRSIRWEEYSQNTEVKDGQVWTPPVLATSGEVIVRSMTIIIMPYNSIVDFHVEHLMLDVKASGAMYDKIMNLIPYEQDVTGPDDIIGGGQIEDVRWTEWLTSAVGGFLSFELVPGLSFSVVLAGLMGVGFLIVLFRFFA